MLTLISHYYIDPLFNPNTKHPFTSAIGHLVRLSLPSSLSLPGGQMTPVYWTALTNL
jgi:hypothetical protein